ncbi:hypothetical protein KRMM14A1004_17790 [Krasilnikovia sp. MM14-A1004]
MPTTGKACVTATGLADVVGVALAVVAAGADGAVELVGADAGAPGAENVGVALGVTKVGAPASSADGPPHPPSATTLTPMSTRLPILDRNTNPSPLVATPKIARTGTGGCPSGQTAPEWHAACSNGSGERSVPGPLPGRGRIGECAYSADARVTRSGRPGRWAWRATG